jgi:hypothetical protein
MRTLARPTGPCTFRGATQPCTRPPWPTPLRRAKRLKKLTRMFTSSAAQSATIAFRQRTWLITAVILTAHLIGFAILVTQIQQRYA